MRSPYIPIAELTLAIKVGFLTRRLWDEFFASGSKSRQSKRWKGLVRSGLFLPHPSPLVKEVIIPNSQHSFVRAISGQAHLGIPFIAQLEHDETVARILVRLERSKTVENYFTELDQKRREPDDRKGAARKERRKFPDAVVTISSPSGPLEVAIELELNVKSQKRYTQIFENYARRSNLKAVVFIVGRRSIYRSIRKALRNAQMPELERLIAFSDVDSWRKDPSNAPIKLRSASTSLAMMRAGKFI